ncbi:MAG TPA: protein kinase [Acidobacteriota bacterium]|nr:protein kinase [Acidobacteriota bacterium]
MADGNDPGATIVAQEPQSDLEVLREHLAPKYKVEKKLGSGGMADVYLGFHNQLKRKVAIKVLPKMFARDEGMVKRFLQEAESAAQLEHPNIISIYDIGVAGHLNYFIMAFVPGGTLKGLLRKKKQLEVKTAGKVVEQICGALQYAHDKGVIHRDIKPDNIMFDERDNAILTDFGIAKAKFASKMTATGTLIGTPHYMSPEQLKGLEVDGRSDIYSLGVMFYEILTGRVPFEGDDTYAVGLKHIQEPPVPPFKLNNKIPQPLNDVILTMLAKTPQARFQKAVEVEEAIKAALGEGGRSPDPGIAAGAEKAVETWRLKRTQVEADFERMKDTLGEAAPGVTPPPLGKVEEQITGGGRSKGTAPPAPTTVRPSTTPPPPTVDGVEERITGDGPVVTGVDRGRPNLVPVFIGIGGAVVILVIVVVVLVLALGRGAPDRGRSSNRSRGDETTSPTAESAAAAVFAGRELLFIEQIQQRPVLREVDKPEASSTTIDTQLWTDANNYAIAVKPSPDNSLLLVEWSNGSLYTVATGATNYTEIFNDPIGPRAGRKYASWSRDGRRVAFVRKQDNFAYLYVIPSTGANASSAEPVFRYQGQIVGPVFSPDGFEIAIGVIAESVSGQSSLLLLDLEAEAWDPLDDYDGRIESLDWSYDGDLIAFTLSSQVGSEIYVFDLEDENGFRVTEGPVDISPMFSPGGRHIVFASNRGGGHALWAVPARGGTAVRLTQQAASGVALVPIGWK